MRTLLLLAALVAVATAKPAYFFDLYEDGSGEPEKPDISEVVIAKEIANVIKGGKEKVERGWSKEYAFQDMLDEFNRQLRGHAFNEVVGSYYIRSMKLLKTAAQELGLNNFSEEVEKWIEDLYKDFQRNTGRKGKEIMSEKNLVGFPVMAKKMKALAEKVKEELEEGKKVENEIYSIALRSDFIMVTIPSMMKAWHGFEVRSLQMLKVALENTIFKKFVPRLEHYIKGKIEQGKKHYGPAKSGGGRKAEGEGED